MHHAFKIGDTEHNLELSRAASGYRLHLSDRIIPVDIKTGADGQSWLTVNGEVCEVVIATRGDNVFIHLDGETHQLVYEHPLERLAHQAHGAASDGVRAPMPGNLVSVQVSAGDAVTKGQTLLVMESMKMETTILAPRDGVVQAVHFDKGQTFDRDALLLTLEPVGAASAATEAESTKTKTR
ncbi:MAG: acetyl-CoA carboxylase biotin carboxyl carrier protein subunit [Nevskiales bacterium]